MKRLVSSTTLLGLLLAGPLCAQQVWVVDEASGPGSDFTTIQPAVDAASDGDLVLIRPGNYAAFVIDGKPLVLQGEGEVLVAHFQVSNLAADQYVGVRGVETTFDSFTTRFENNAGPVLLEDVSGVPLSFESCARVVLRDLDIDASVGSEAVRANGSNLAVYDSHLKGGEGRFPISPQANPGLAAVRLTGSTLVAMGCTLEGGRGSPEFDGAFFAPAGAGGDGCELLGNSQMEVIDTVSIGGPDGNVPPVRFGVPFDVRAGSLLRRRPHASRAMHVASPLREGETTPFVFTGQPGDVVHLYVSREPGEWTTHPRRIGPRTVGPVLQVIPIGTIPASGALSVDFTAPSIPGESHTFFLQAAFLGGNGLALWSFVHGAPTLVNLLDASL